MPQSLLVFVPSDDPIPLEELHELSGQERIVQEQEASGKRVGYRVQWDAMQLHLEFLPPQENEERLNEFLLHLDALLGGRDDKKARKLWRRAERMVQVIRCTVTPDWDDQRQAQHLVQGLMNYYDYALMLAEETVYNENGNIEVGAKDSRPKYWAQPKVDPDTTRALRRKKRSLQQLKAEKVPYIEHLPVILDEEHSAIRPVDEVVPRALALYWISRRAEGLSRKEYEQAIQRYKLHEAVTPDERLFAQDDDPEEYLVLKFSQRLESCWTLLWALSFVDQLAFPNSFAPPERIQEIIETRSPEQFALEAKLRPASDILDAADRAYRYHWAVVDAQLYGKTPPRGLQAAVVYERHYALNWLRGYQGQEWDRVTTDT